MALSQGLAKTFGNLSARGSTSAATLNPAEDAESFLSGLSDVQRLLLKLHTPPHLFVVISWGAAATNWITHVMNSHPDVLCLHEGNARLKLFGGWDTLDGLEYAQVLMMLGIGYKAAGDIHGVSRHHVPHLKQAFGDRISTAVVVREPMQRLSSQTAAYAQFRDVRDHYWKPDYIDSLIDQYEVRLPALDADHKLFVHGANMLNAIVEEWQVGTIYRCEDLTTDPDALRRFVTEMTGDQVEVSDAWLSRELSRKGINSHGGKCREPWAEWQMEVIRKVVRSESWTLYEELGYERPHFVR